jgi:hypothetical protein
MNGEITLRIIVEHPPAGVRWALQRGRFELVPPSLSADDGLTFDFTLHVANTPADGAPNLRGRAAQGSPADRFVYLCSGTSAGQAGSRWTRRAKVPLKGIGWPLVERGLAAPGAVLTARIGGVARDGGPACATVPLLDGGWRMVDGERSG